MTIRRGPVIPGTCAGCGRTLKRPDPPRLVVAGFHVADTGGLPRMYTPGLDLAFCPRCWGGEVALRDLEAILERAAEAAEGFVPVPPTSTTREEHLAWAAWQLDRVAAFADAADAAVSLGWGPFDRDRFLAEAEVGIQFASEILKVHGTPWTDPWSESDSGLAAVQPEVEP